MKNKSIAILGAGTTGLAAASFLKIAGFEVVLYEKFQTPKPMGAGLLLQPTGLACLARLNLDQEAKKFAAQVNRLQGMTVDQREIFDLYYKDLAPNLFGLGIHRGTLFHLLYEKAKSLNVEIITGFEACDITISKEKHILISSDGRRTPSFDLVIDASGMNSLIRNKFADIKLNKPYPYGAVWGVCEDKDQLLGRDILQQRYDKAKIMVGILPIGKTPENPIKDHVAFFWSLRQKDYPAWQSSPLDHWKGIVGSSWSKTPPLLEQFSDHSHLARAQYNDVILNKFHTDRVVFLGDAAHSTSPQLGQGANLGLIDALLFSEYFGNINDIDEAISSYNQARKQHVHFYQFASRWLTPFFQSDSLIAAKLRDTFFSPMCKIPYVRQHMLETLFGIKTGLFKSLNPGDWHKAYHIE